jgi:hypothetical protein
MENSYLVTKGSKRGRGFIPLVLIGFAAIFAAGASTWAADLFGRNFYRPVRGKALQYQMFVENIRPEVFFITQDQVNDIVNATDEERVFQAYRYRDAIQSIRACPKIAQAIHDVGAKKTAGATAKLTKILTEGVKNLEYWNYESRLSSLENCLRNIGELSDFMVVTRQQNAISATMVQSLLQQLADFRLQNYPSQESQDNF